VHTPCFSYIDFNIIFANMPTPFLWCFIIQIFHTKYYLCNSQFFSPSVALFRSFDTIKQSVIWLGFVYRVSLKFSCCWARRMLNCAESGEVQQTKPFSFHTWLKSLVPSSTDYALQTSFAVHSFSDPTTLELNDTSDPWTGTFCSDCILPTHYRNTRTKFQVPIRHFRAPN